MPTTISVALGDRSYEIEISRGNLRGIAAFIQQHRPCSHAIVITDSNVGPLFAQPINQSLSAAGIRTDLLTVPAGETSKCVAQAEQLWNELAARNADRKTVVIAVGGGVIGDLAGFIAATYARGLSFIQIPTSLLAQVDSSVGGKVGINLPAAKNIVGAFWQPVGVLIDLDVLQTLPEREFRSGLAEVVKYGVIMDAEFFNYLEQHADAIGRRDSDRLEHIVAQSCRLKALVVADDEREETGRRAILNYGHTFCHAIEQVSGYGQFLHGEAVAIGMICASRLAEDLGYIDAAMTQRQQQLLKQLGLPVAVPALDENALLTAMQHDKKTENGKLRFVLPRQMGHVEVISGVEAERVRKALRINRN
ncbi:MAG TPA: 3-dehydroquinate synthase [Pirellulaceae bacterium]|jgi:3-dehydroquinate synthase